MQIQAKYYANLKGGTSIFLCDHHLNKVARKIDSAGRMELKRGVRSIGSLHPFTPKHCEECLHDQKFVPAQSHQEVTSCSHP